MENNLIELYYITHFKNCYNTNIVKQSKTSEDNFQDKILILLETNYENVNELEGIVHIQKYMKTIH